MEGAPYDVPRLRAAEFVAFSGGGARGMAYVGFLCALSELAGVELAGRVKGASGTSIGALFALLVALGYRSGEVAAVLDEVELGHMVAPNPLLALTDVRAADDGGRLRAVISALVSRKLGGARDATLWDLRRRTGVDLVVVATDVTDATVRYLRADTEPAMSVVQAVYASMALPALFAPLAYRGHELQDGGGMDNLPVGAWGEAGRGRTVSAALHWVVHPPGPGEGVVAYLARSMYCAMYPGMVADWCLMPPEDRALCFVLDVSEVPVVTALTPEVKEHARSKGYQDAAGSLKRMASGAAPLPASSRFARRDGIPHRLVALLDAADAADAAAR